MLFKNEVDDKTMFDMPLPTGKASPNNISMQLRTTRGRRDPGDDDDPYQSDDNGEMTKEKYDEMIDALESTTPTGVEYDLKRHGVNIGDSREQLATQFTTITTQQAAPPA